MLGLESIILITLAAAVIPAVPIDIASKAERFSGFLTIQPSGTLMNSPNPPGVFIPRS